MTLSSVFASYGADMNPMRALVYHKRRVYDTFSFGADLMRLVTSEEEMALRASRFVKAELKRAGLTYANLAERLKDHGLPSETEASIKAKLRRGTFTATFLLATLAALELEGVRLEDL
jgi:2-hydroxychromene-2-carboxylate isomerase